MKKFKQILALLGIFILVGMYIATIICAVSSNENFMAMLFASIYASVVIPVLIWAATFLFRLFSKNNDTES